MQCCMAAGKGCKMKMWRYIAALQSYIVAMQSCIASLQSCIVAM